ncbi:MAG: helix-turn-helix domain-containing protein [Pseudomonadota bacterium]
MKVNLGETHYQILQVPVTATLFEIRQAYTDACALYSEEALVTYSMFDPGQRKVILATLAEAFQTLVDPARRQAYDAYLIEAGALSADVLANDEKQNKKPIPIFEVPTAASTDSVKKRIRAASGSADFRRQVDGVLEKERISGSDLRQIREKLGITCEEIYDATRISVSIITAIESDNAANLPSALYLKNFLKTYATLLEMDPVRTMAGYLKNLGMD